MKRKLQELIDIKQLQKLQDRMYELYSFTSAILDNEGNILTATAWQDVCTTFHKKDIECEKKCINSDLYITGCLNDAKPSITYQCANGLINNATPIVIEGVHYGTFYVGQFFLVSPDLEFFKQQAKKYGFDEASYLEAVKKVPIWTKEKLDQYISFMKELIEAISGIGAKNLRELETREKKLLESEEKYRNVVESANEAIHVAQDERIVYANPKLIEVTGFSFEEMKDKPFIDFIHPDDREMVLNRYKGRLASEKIPDTYEYRSISKDNRIIWFYIAAKKIEWNGKPATLNMLTDITVRKQVEEALRERVKELNCIYSITDFINKTADLNDIYQATIHLVIHGLSYPEIACARIILGEKQYKTDNFKETRWKISADINVKHKSAGVLEVCYLKEMPIKDDGPFFNEELSVITIIADRIGKATERKKYEEERESLVSELQNAIAEIKQLSGLLPICSSCKKIRDDAGSWQQMELYIRDHSNAEFSHGLCPDCARKLYPKFIHEK